ncbi:MAG: hypothetical protein WCX71_04660 [Candidatus Buchananbacteria bacterium]
MAKKVTNTSVATMVGTKVSTAIGTSILVSLTVLSMLTVIQTLVALENDSHIVLNNLHLLK